MKTPTGKKADIQNSSKMINAHFKLKVLHLFPFNNPQ